MATKMRLQRHGKKGRPFYHIVIADGRAPRDGRFIDTIGSYNPLSVPAEINIDFDRALQWYQKGVQPTATVRAILSSKGILLKNHLLKGVSKGALTPEQAEAKFQNWVQEKEAQIQAKIKDRELSRKDAMKKRMEHEAKINQSKAEAIFRKKAKEAEAAAATTAPEETAPEAEAPATETEAPAE